VQSPARVRELSACFLESPNHERIRVLICGTGQRALTAFMGHLDSEDRITNLPEDGLVDPLVWGGAEVFVESVHRAQATSTV